jgi:hypothetical protein
MSLGLVLLDHMAELGLVFKEASILISIVVVTANISTSSVCGSFLLSSSPIFFLLVVFLMIAI